MKIQIESIQHKKQRYPTCGDWFTKDGVLHVKVSEEMGEDSAMLVAIHELVEVFLCKKAGIKEADVDAFDTAFEAKREKGNDDEPGDAPNAPYQRQHNIATGIERLLCAEIGMKWAEHADNVERLP